MNRLATLQQMEAQQPHEAFLKYAIALEYVSLQQDMEALRYFELLTANFAAYVPTYLHLGQLYERIGMVNKAINTYRQGILAARQAGDNKTVAELNEALALAEEE